MDNEPRHSLTLLAAACLTFCGVAVLAVGVGMAGAPVQRSVCMSFAPSLCCTLTGSEFAAMPPLIAVPTLHAIAIMSD